MQRWWKGFLLVVATLSTAWALVPSTGAHDVLYDSIGFLSVASVVFGAVRYRPSSRWTWWLIALGVLLVVLAHGVLPHRGGLVIEPGPSSTDAVHLSAYVALAVAFSALVRARRSGRDAAGRIDAGVVTVSVGLIAWTLVGAPLVARHGLTPTTLLAMSYPAADIMLLGVVTRLSLGPGAGTAAYRLLVASIATLLVADGLYAVRGATASDAGRWLDAAWLVSYALAGTAALHPTMRQLSERCEQVRPVAWQRLAGLYVAVFVAPAVQVLQGTARQAWPAVAASTLLMGMALSRLQLALHAAQTSARLRTQLQDRLAHQAAHDSLTNAANRSHSLEAITAALHAAELTGRPVGLLYVDLDHFKQVNDTLGHAVGDQVLTAVVGRIQEVIRPGDLVGRVGGDELVVLVSDAASDRLLVEVANRIVQAVERRVRVGEHALWLSASVGVARSHPGMLDADELIRDADAAVYRAKSEGRARVQVFDDELRQELSDQADAEAAIRHGLVAGEFVMHYQPLLELRTGSVVGYEALARWQRPGHGLVPPGAFIPLAEKSSLICDIGRWALYEATAQVAAWDRESRAPAQVSVNVSGRHLASTAIVDDLVGACVAAGVAPERLVLEVTETVPLDTPVMRTQLTALRRLGVGIHIDDFGTGYTSIGQLRNLPASALKIDRSLIALDDPGARELVALAVHAAHTAGLQVVAEGVETAAQLTALRQMGCDLAQGFHIAHPAPADQVATTLGPRYRVEPAAESSNPALNAATPS